MSAQTAQPMPLLRRSSARQLTIRWVTVVLLAASIALMVLHASDIRALEAKAVAFWLDPVLPGGAQALHTYFLIHLNGGHGDLIAFNVTTECTAVLILVPLTATAAVLLAVTPVKPVQALAALAAAATAATAANQLRLGLIAFTSQRWGMGLGFDLGHRYIGSIFSLAAFAVGFIVILRVCLGGLASPSGRQSRASRTTGGAP